MGFPKELKDVLFAEVIAVRNVCWALNFLIIIQIIYL